MPLIPLLTALLALPVSPGPSTAEGDEASQERTGAQIDLPPAPEGMRVLSLNEQRARVETAQSSVPRVEHPRSFDVAPFAAISDIPIELAPAVGDLLAHYQGPGRAGMRTLMRRLTRYLPLMQPVLAAHELPLELIAVAMIESSLTTDQVSHAQAAGPWQFVPSTGEAYGLRQTYWVDERRDPVRSTDAAARYLKELHARFGHWYLAFASYNTGGARMGRVIESAGTRDFWKLRHRLSEETRNYVPRIVAVALIARHPAAFGFSHEEFEYLEPHAFEEVALNEQVDLSFAARSIGTDVAHLRELNPELLRWLTPPATTEAPYELRVPPGTAARLKARIAKVSRAERLNAKVHRVGRGDSVSRIAKRYRTPPQVIRDANRLVSDRHLRLGTRIVVPTPPGTVAAREGAPSGTKEGTSPAKPQPSPSKRQARRGR